MVSASFSDVSLFAFSLVSTSHLFCHGFVDGFTPLDEQTDEEEERTFVGVFPIPPSNLLPPLPPLPSQLIAVTTRAAPYTRTHARIYHHWLLHMHAFLHAFYFLAVCWTGQKTCAFGQKTGTRTDKFWTGFMPPPHGLPCAGTEKHFVPCLLHDLATHFCTRLRLSHSLFSPLIPSLWVQVHSSSSLLYPIPPLSSPSSPLSHLVPAIPLPPCLTMGGLLVDARAASCTSIPSLLYYILQEE